MKYHTIVLLCMMSLIVACSSGDSNANEDSNADTSAKALRVGVVPIEECLPIYVAKHLGLLDSLHADVRVISYDALSECKEALHKKQVDAIINDSVVNFKFLTSKKSRIHRISQLSDKVIAADGEGYSANLAYEAIDSLLKQERHMFIIRVEDLNVRSKMLKTGNVDAALLPEPWASEAKKTGAFEVESFAKRVERPMFKTNGRINGKKLDEAIKVAQDSIKKYGKENYAYTLDK